MAHCTEWLGNESPPYAAYRGLNVCRQLAADKRPGVQPLECGESWMYLILGCNNDPTRTQATIVCANAQLCAAIWPQSAGWTHDGGIPSEDGDDKLDNADAPQIQQLQVRYSLAAEDPLIDT